MEQKDYILREVEKIGVMLQYMLGKFRPGKSIQQLDLTEELNQKMRENLGYDMPTLLSLERNQFPAMLNEKHGFNLDNLELLSDLLYQMSLQYPAEEKRYLVKALEILEHINEKWKTYSYERENKIERIKYSIDTDN